MFGKNFDPFNQQRPLAGRPMEKNGKEKTQTGKVLRYMFNPEIGDDIKNFRQNHTHFLRLITNIFLQTGLIDASYRGLANPDRYGLKELLVHAYRNLRFTREGLPQVLLYFAFVGSLVVVALSIVFFILSLSSHPAAPPVPR
ncbi:MAG: hypothetical protein EB059_10050 [Alphaproteobacteria bacterium]|nr:hypothetical protein [Alphaproteobacteria bacterium]